MIIPYIDQFGRIAYRDSDSPASKPMISNPFTPTNTDPTVPPVPTTTGPVVDPNATQHTGGEGGGDQDRDTGSTPAGGAPRDSKDGTALGGLMEVGGYLAQATSIPGIIDGVVEGLTGVSAFDRMKDAITGTDTVADRENAIQGADLSDRSGFAADQGDRSAATGDRSGEGVGTGGESGAPSGGGTGADPDGGAAYNKGGLITKPGMVRGPGGPTEDKVEARLSDGEYVMTAAAVKVFGKEFFDKINQLAKKGGLMAPGKNDVMPIEDEMMDESMIEGDPGLGGAAMPPPAKGMMGDPAMGLAEGGPVKKPDYNRYQLLSEALAEGKITREEYEQAFNDILDNFGDRAAKASGRFQSGKDDIDREFKIPVDKPYLAKGGMVQKPMDRHPATTIKKRQPMQTQAQRPGGLAGRPKKFTMEFH